MQKNLIELRLRNAIADKEILIATANRDLQFGDGWRCDYAEQYYATSKEIENLFILLSRCENTTNWFMLYDGSSNDGRGYPRYCGRTTDKKEALKHFKKCSKNPYSIGQVKIITESKETIAIDEQLFNQL